jgi:hypothetical protein
MGQTKDERLNRLTEAVTRAGGLSDQEADGVASSPFLYTRLRAGIQAERERREGQGSTWLALLRVASRTIAFLLVVTAAAVVAFWVSGQSKIGRAPDANVTSNNLDRVIEGGTCALSATDQCAISNDEVLATLFAKGGETEK